MIKTNIIEKCKKCIEKDGIKAIDILINDNEIRKENVGDFFDSLVYATEKHIEKKIYPEKAEQLNKDLKVEINGFIKNINTKLFYK